MAKKEGKHASISPKVVIKIPACLEGFKAMKRIRKESLFLSEICITTVTTAAEALNAASAVLEKLYPITEWYLKLFQEAAQNKEALDE